MKLSFIAIILAFSSTVSHAGNLSCEDSFGNKVTENGKFTEEGKARAQRTNSFECVYEFTFEGFNGDYGKALMEGAVREWYSAYQKWSAIEDKTSKDAIELLQKFNLPHCLELDSTYNAVLRTSGSSLNDPEIVFEKKRVEDITGCEKIKNFASFPIKWECQYAPAKPIHR